MSRASLPDVHNLPRIVPSTIDGKDLRIRDYEAISQLVPLSLNEPIHLLYMNSNSFDKPFKLSEECIVGITPLQIFKIEHGGVDRVFIADILKVRYQENGLFHWDKVEMDLLNRKETMGISPAETCRYFTNYLTTLVNRYQHQQQQQQQQQLAAQEASPAYTPLSPTQLFFGR